MLMFTMAKPNSMRLPGKNMLEFAGRPLVEWTFRAMKMFEGVKLCCFTWDRRIVALAERYKILALDLPELLRQDDTPLEDKLRYIMELYHHEQEFVLVPPTSPVRDPKLLRFWTNDFINSSKRYGASVYHTSRRVWELSGSVFFWKDPIDPIDWSDPFLVSDFAHVDIDTRDHFDDAQERWGAWLATHL